MRAAIVHALGDAGDVCLGGRWRVVHAHAVAVLVEDGVDGQEVEVRNVPGTAPAAATRAPRRRGGPRA
jgi:hypothetical protein